MNSQPNQSEMGRPFFQLDKFPTHLVNDRCEVNVVGVAFNVHHNSDSVVEGEYAVSFR